MANKFTAEAEEDRLFNLLERAHVGSHTVAALSSIIYNLAWQRAKLDQAREQMQEENLVCIYDNGGGQTGERENPIFKAYINLFRAYMVGMEKYLSYLPKDLQEEALDNAMNVLAQVRMMKKGNV